MMMTPVLSLKQHRNFSTGRHILQIWNKTHYYNCDLVFQWSSIWYIDVIDLYVHISTFILQKLSIASTKLSVLNAKFQLQHQISMKVNLEWRRCFTNVWLCVNRGGLACLLLRLQKKPGHQEGIRFHKEKQLFSSNHLMRMLQISDVWSDT